MRFLFSFVSRYHDETDFLCEDRETGSRRRITLTDKRHARHVAEDLAPETLEAFNAWLLACHTADHTFVLEKLGKEAADRLAPFVPAYTGKVR